MATSCPCPECVCSLDALLSFTPSMRTAQLILLDGVPNIIERATIQDENERLKSQISELNARISQTEASLEQLRTARDALQAQLAAQTNILSPIQTLPADILCEVFACATNTDYRHADATPWLVSAVSRRWRTTATSFARLWSHIDISSSSESRQGQAVCDRIILQTQRSRQYPLSLYLKLHRHFKFFEQFPDIVRLLAETSHRWKRLFLGGSLLSFFRPLITQELPLPLLQEAQIDTGHIGSGTKYPFFRQASSLTKLSGPLATLVQFEWQASPVDLCVYSSQGFRIRQGAVTEIIRQFIRLKVLSYQTHIDSSPKLCGSPLMMSDLTELTIYFEGNFDGADPLLDALEAPNLVHLRLGGFIDESVLSCILSLYARSDFKLSKLTLDLDSRTEAETLFDILESLPTICELSFQSNPSSRHLGGSLMQELAQNTTMAPNLKLLSLDTSWEEVLPNLSNARPDLCLDFFQYLVDY